MSMLGEVSKNLAVNCAKELSTYTWGAAVPVRLNVRTFGCIGELTAGSALLKESELNSCHNVVATLEDRLSTFCLYLLLLQGGHTWKSIT